MGFAPRLRGGNGILVSIEPRLTFCALICEDLARPVEDLARQDPVAEVVRAVGPDLMIALLMDGPPRHRLGQ